MFISISISLIISTFCLTDIELKLSLSNNHSEYLINLKFQQIVTYGNGLSVEESQLYSKYTSFIEENDITLHQQVLAQKRLATYYGNINVGFGRDNDPNKTQTFKMLFDTGSCEFWIASDKCVTPRCLAHARYTESKTLNNYKNSKMAIQYLSGKVEGKMATENIQVGDLIIPNQVIGIANEVDIPLLDEVIWDGILGLAYPNNNLKKQGISPLFDNIINQSLLIKKGEKNQFAYYLGHDRGSISFGGADMKFKKDLNEEFKWAPITERNYWTIDLLDIKKYKKNQNNNDDMIEDALCPSGCKSIVDTGTYLIYGPSNQLMNFLSDMTIHNCEDKANLPNLGFVFKGMEKNGKETAFELILTPDEYVLEFEIDGRNDCVVGIGSDSEDSGWTLGQVFLKSYYTVFDRDAEAIGFVKSNPYPQQLKSKENNKNDAPFLASFLKSELKDGPLL